MKINNTYEVLTPSGWKNFSGINKTEKNEYISFEFDSEKTLKCSLCHKIDTKSGYTYAEDLYVGDIVLDIDGETTIISRLIIDEPISLFDLTDVEDERNRFFANDLVVSNCAFISSTVWESFYKSVYPTISSGKTSKFIMTSTANGFNHFYKFVDDARNSRSSFKLFEVSWRDVPGRDEAWKLETIQNTSEEAFLQEHENIFLGSSGTLINMNKVNSLVYEIPIQETNLGIKIYSHPISDISNESGVIPTYVILSDVSEGVGGDYSTASVIRTDILPYEQVATYRNNTISPTVEFPEILHWLSQYYNNAFILIETNISVGTETAKVLHQELENECVLMTSMNGAKGQVISSGFGNSPRYGVKMSKAVKRIGCTKLKDLIEMDKLILHDYDTISEISTFVRKKDSYEADDSNHDDMVMGLVLFGWLTCQQYFKDLNESIDREKLFGERIRGIEQNLAPIGFFPDSHESIEEVESYNDFMRS